MKTFAELTSIDKAKAIHELFPGVIDQFLTFAEETASHIISSPPKAGKIPPDIWIKEAKALLETISLHRQQLITHSTFFAEHLFKGYLDFLPIHCLKEYAFICPEAKFQDAIFFLFEN